MGNYNNSQPIQEAVGIDKLQTEGLFYSDVLAYISAATLTNSLVSIVRVIEHPVKPGTRLYYLSPRSLCEKLWQDFRSGLLRVDPKLHSQKIYEIKNMELTEKPAPIGKQFSTEYLSPRQQVQLEELKQREILKEGGGR